MKKKMKKNMDGTASVLEMNKLFSLEENQENGGYLHSC